MAPDEPTAKKMQAEHSTWRDSSPDEIIADIEWIRTMCSAITVLLDVLYPPDLVDRICRGIARMEKSDRRRARMRRKKRRGWA